MVFISYSSKDTDAANAVRMVLQNNGIDCWMAPESIAMGDDYSNAIPKAIEVCDLFLLILSVNSQGSKWVPKELDSAISRSKPIIPFQIDSEALTTSFNFMLSNIQRIEAFYDLEKSYAKLLAHIKIELNSYNHEINDKQTAVKAPKISTHFTKLLKEMYFIMVAYIEAVQAGNVETMNNEIKNMQGQAHKLFIFYENNRISDKEDAIMAKQIVDNYNDFAESYNQFASFPPGESRMSSIAQEYAKNAEKIFYSLMDTIVELCNVSGD